MLKVTNFRKAKPKEGDTSGGQVMNGCKVFGVAFADVVDTDTSSIIYSGTVAMCHGKMEMLGFS